MESAPLKQKLPEFAKAIAEWFPELEGRSFAVSEVDPFSNRTDVPTLPLAVVALVNSSGTQSRNGGGTVTLEDDILVQFIYKPVKYQNAAQRDTPFFAYYDFENLRDRLLYHTQSYRTPRNGSMAFRSLDVESDEYAVYIAVRFISQERWCWTPPEGLPVPPLVDIQRVKACAKYLTCEIDPNTTQEDAEDDCPWTDLPIKE